MYAIVLCKKVILRDVRLLVENLLHWGKCIALLCRVFANQVTIIHESFLLLQDESSSYHSARNYKLIFYQLKIRRCIS